MDTVGAIENLCRLPADFKSGDQSAYDLVRASGVECRSLTAASVLPILQSHPDLVDDWILWAEDQRCSPAYYLLKEGDAYVVGRQSGEDRVEFDDRLDACADYIVKAVNLIW